MQNDTQWGNLSNGDTVSSASQLLLRQTYIAPGNGQWRWKGVCNFGL